MLLLLLLLPAAAASMHPPAHTHAALSPSRPPHATPPATRHAGGSITFDMVTSQAAAIIAASLVPYSAEAFRATNGSAISAAVHGAVKCAALLTSALAPSQATCTMGRLAVGAYLLMVQLRSGTIVLASTPIPVELAVTEVVPNLGSIAGGTTIKIAGGQQRAAGGP